MLIDFRELFPRYKIRPKGVLHVGANRGEEAEVYNELGIKNVAWFDANPEFAPALQRHADRYGHRFYIICCGDEDAKEERPFHISNNAGQSSSVLELGTHLIEHPDVHYVRDIPVKTRRLDTLIYNGELPFFNIDDYDFLNCDTQGFDLNVMKGLGFLLDKFKWVYIEVNSSEIYKNCGQLQELEDYFLKFGLKKRELKFAPNKTWGDCLFIKET